jgi:HTH-type transcriptional repressor of NAD biosynthesis genes
MEGERAAESAASNAGERMSTALVFGKFYPLHAGHLGLIAAARAAADEVIVLVLASVQESVSLDQRMRWVRESAPDVLVVGGYDEAPMGESDELWDAHIAAIHSALPQVPDVLIADEWYAAETARRLGCAHLTLDPGRDILPISGTQLRADLPAYWGLLPAAVRADLAHRVVIVGAESTGTTTLARDLAESLGTVWVPEYGRTYSELKGPLNAWLWSGREFDVIAHEQSAQEDAAARLCGPVLVVDTDALATAVWHERYIGSRSTSVEHFAATRRPDLYVLTSPDGVAWEDDGMRDGLGERAWMHQRFRQTLMESGTPWIEVVGSPSERVGLAEAAIADLSWDFAPPLG